MFNPFQLRAHQRDKLCRRIKITIITRNFFLPFRLANDILKSREGNERPRGACGHRGMLVEKTASVLNILWLI